MVEHIIFFPTPINTGGQKTSNPLQGQAMAAVQAMWYALFINS